MTEAPMKATADLSFSEALRALKSGKRVARSGWNGKGMWLAIIDAAGWQFVSTPVTVLGLEKLPWIGMKTADSKFVPWLASQTDILAEDWQIIE